MKIALSLLSILSTALLVQGSPLSADQHWTAFKARYGSQFSDIESRKEAFLAAKALVDQHNAEADQGLQLYYMEVNKFSVMTEDEAKMYKGLNPASMLNGGAQEYVMSGVTVPASIDLRTSKCMPAVQDQASCGSCWAFSTIHNIDYRHCVKHDLAAPITFSPQNLVDCSTSNSGCNGGDQVAAYEDIIKDMPSGVMTSAEYPYKARHGKCAYDAHKGVGKVTSVTAMMKTGAAAVAAMKEAIATGGSISVSIDASSAFMKYTSGIFTGPCTHFVNHAVNAVGYGTDAATGTDYWIVRNSWGPDAGLNGYWLMKSGVNLCGIELPGQVSWPTL